MALQNRFSRLFDNALFPMMEDFLDSEIPDHFNLRIESLTVDLGTIDYDNLERDITDIFIKAFKKALYEITGSMYAALPFATNEASSQNDLRNKYLTVTEFFLTKGVLPWWAAGEILSDPLKVISELLDTEKKALKNLLYSIGYREAVRRRLAYQLPEEQVKEIIRVLEPADAEFIFQYHKEISELEYHEQFVKSESKEFAKAVWMFVLEYLLVDRSSVFEEKSFVKTSIHKMASFFNVNYEKLLISFYESLQMMYPSKRANDHLVLIIADVYHEHFIPADRKNNSVSAEPAAQSDTEEMRLLYKMKVIKYYLQNGNFSFDAGLYTHTAIKKWMHELFNKTPGVFSTFLSDAFKDAVQRRRMFLLMDNMLIKKWISVLPAGNSGAVDRYIEILQSLMNDDFVFQSAVGRILSFEGKDFELNKFVRQHLFDVSAISGVAYKNLSRSLLQGIIQQYNTNSRNEAVAAVLSALLKENEPEHALTLMPVNTVTKEVPQQKTISFEDEPGLPAIDELLRFYIYFGSLPWWAAGDGIHKTAVQYMDELASGDSVKIISFLKLTGADNAARQRLVSYFPAQQIISLFKKLPGADKAISFFEEMLLLLDSSFIAEFITAENRKRLLLLLFWEAHLSDAYRYFSNKDLIARIAKHLEQLLHTEAFIILNNFENTVAKTGKKFTSSLRQELHEAAVAFTAAEKTSAASNDETSLDEIIKQYKPSQTGTDSNAILQAYAEIVIYFLQYNKLPAEITNTVTDVELFIKALILKIYFSNTASLIQIFERGDYNKEAVSKLYWLFYHRKDEAEHEIFNMLATNAERNITAQFQQLFDAPGAGTEAQNNLQQITNELLGFTGTDPDEINTDVLINDVLLKDEQKDPQKIIYEAEQLFCEMIFEHKAGIVSEGPDKFSRDYFLLHLSQLLYQKNPDVLKQIATAAAEAGNENIIHLHHFLSLQQRSAFKAVFDLLDEILKKYVTAYANALTDTKFDDEEIFIQHADNDAGAASATPQPAIKVNVTEAVQQYANQAAVSFAEATFILLKKIFAREYSTFFSTSTGDNEKNIVLKELMLTAYREEPLKLKDILNKPSVIPASFETLNHLFSNTATTEERSIQYFIKNAAEKNILGLLEQEELYIQDGVPKDLNTAIAKMPEQSSEKFLIQLLQRKDDGNLHLQTAVPYISDEAVDKFLTAQQHVSNKYLVFFLKEFRLLLGHVKLFYADKEALLNLYRQFLLHFAAGKVSATNLITCIKAYFNYAEQYNAPLMFKFYVSFNDFIIHGSPNLLFSSILPQLQKEMEQRISARTKLIASPLSSSSGVAQISAADAVLLKKIKQETIRKKQSEKSKVQEKKYTTSEEQNTEKIYVTNAGLVLLHPFLSTYFSRLGLLNNGTFINAASQQRAVHLLAFITDGKEQYREHILPLNKILCGLSLNEPPDYAFSIKEEEKQLSTQMLHVIFQSWEKLKNSTIEGFRESFLKRQGILTYNEGAWNLRVEQRGYDVLLETIPWGFRFIKSSWMDAILTVEWI